jgi:hypothetical protein
MISYFNAIRDQALLNFKVMFRASGPFSFGSHASVPCRVIPLASFPHLAEIGDTSVAQNRKSRDSVAGRDRKIIKSHA